jgi:hypothetical protein
MEQLNLLNPVYVIGNIVHELERSFRTFDFSQPHTWLLIPAIFSLFRATDLLLEGVKAKFASTRMP